MTTEWVTVYIKPFSTNQIHLGRKVLSPNYRHFRKEFSKLLPDIEVPKGPLVLSVVVGVSNRNSDLDNTFKPFLDALAERYGFNDRQIFRIIATKKIVKKGKESFNFNLSEYQGET
ncbi:RusA family crossover junction endodeoxyribonuclease [Pleionea sp. CnH1-48]|uniref:RusA family crossover junction endodeoxyribonuclease n=1 Tax=Pleionea sp. CnH1-48 TaxID=2954494 RepID=UPI002097FAE0|nr:RusA family crossover junction endodeoxyribonuclease [Pleionea sp. CnH1-48]MCO7225292.1 RusA family crossover junction endodeoxyribonuclease [Pleionea sp. CnH1-48]